MNSSDNDIKARVANFRIDVSEAMHQRTVKDILAAHEDSAAVDNSKAPAGGTPQPEQKARRLMKTLKWLTPTTAAASIAIAVIAWLLLQGPDIVPSAYAELNQAIENTKAAQWMHVRYPTSLGKGEYWISFRPFRSFYKSAKLVLFTDGQKQQEFRYDIASRTITVRPLSEQQKEFASKNSFLDLTMALMKLGRKNEDVKIVKTIEEIEGKEYTVFSISTTEPKRAKTQLWIDSATKRLARMHIEGEELPKPITVNLDYPKTGPTSIYAMGIVPRDAKIVDLSPAKELIALDKNVRVAIDAFAPSYYAIMYLVSPGESRPTVVRVTYKKAGKFRLEKYGPTLGKDVPMANMKAMEGWLKQRKPQMLRFLERGGHKGVKLRLDPATGNLVRASYRGPISWTVEWLCWGLGGARQAAGAVVIHDDSTARDTLLIRQHTIQGKTYDGRVIIYPMRVRSYFNPKRDYLCHRHEQVEDAKAPWQRNEQWLKNLADKPSIRDHRRVSRWEILEYAQTAQGQWYAKRVGVEHHSSTGKSRSIWNIHLDTTREISDDLFDPAKITKDSFR